MEEQVVAKPVKSGIWKWIFGVVLAVVLFTVGAWFLIFRVNQFSFVLEMAGEANLFLEYGETYEEPGVKPVLYGTLFFKEGITPEEANIQIQSDLQEAVLGKFRRHCVNHCRTLDNCDDHLVNYAIDADLPSGYLNNEHERID